MTVNLELFIRGIHKPVVNCSNDFRTVVLVGNYPRILVDVGIIEFLERQYEFVFRIGKAYCRTRRRVLYHIGNERIYDLSIGVAKLFPYGGWNIFVPDKSRGNGVFYIASEVGNLICKTGYAALVGGGKNVSRIYI